MHPLKGLGLAGLPFAALLFVACGDSPDRSASPDATTDVVNDVVNDVTTDAGDLADSGDIPDVTRDAGPDSGPDSGPDVGPDALPDAGPDALPDASLDAAPDALLDIRPDAIELPDLGTVPVEVGPSGGVVHSADGRVRLAFPAGALSESETITIEPIDVDDLTPLEGLPPHDLAYELGPDGLSFDEPVRLTLTLDAEDVLDADAPGVYPHVYVLHGSPTELEILNDGTARFTDHECIVTAEIEHFSVFTAANAPVVSQLVAPDPTGGRGSIFNFRHTVGLRRVTAAGDGWRPLIQNALRGRFLELRLLPGVYPPFFSGGFYGPDPWPQGANIDHTATEEIRTYIFAGDVRMYVSDQTVCTRSDVVTDTFMTSTVGVVTSGGVFTAASEIRSTVEYTIDVNCGLESDREGYYEKDRFVYLSSSWPVDELDTPAEPARPEVDPDEQASLLFGADSEAIGPITLDDEGGSLTPIATPEAATNALVTFGRDDTVGIYVLAEGGGQRLYTVEREAPGELVDSEDLGVTDAAEEGALHVVHTTENRRPEVAVIGPERARIIDPHPLFTFGETNLAAAGAVHGPVVAQQYVFYSGPTCNGGPDACPASGFAAAVLGHAPLAGGEGGRISFTSTLGHGSSEAVPGSVVGMRCRTPYECVVVVEAGESGAVRQTALRVDIDPTAAAGGNLRLSTLGTLPSDLGELVDFALTADGGTVAAAYEEALAVAYAVDSGALELIVDPAPASCDAIRQVVTSAGELGVRCDDQVYLRAFGPEAFGRDGCGEDVTPEPGPAFGTGLRISAGREHRTAIDGPAGAVWEVVARSSADDASHLSLVADGGAPVRALREEGGDWVASTLVRSTGPGPGPAEANLRVVAGMRPALREGDRCTPYTLTARRLQFDPDDFEPSSPAPSEQIAVSFVRGRAQVVGLTLTEGDVDGFTFDTASDVACQVVVTGPAVAGLAADFGVDFALVDRRDKALGDIVGVARSRVTDVAYELHCVERAGGGSAEVCEGGSDEDRDGLVDCDDPDCHWESGCARYREQCSNGIDDDGDWRLDCADPDCIGFAACGESAAEDCGSAEDEDSDGQVGCDDLDCTFDPACGLAGEDCENGEDDDGDDDIDCDDEDCAAVCTCFDEEGGPRGDVAVRFGSMLGDLGRAVCIYDTCGTAYSSEPIWDAEGFAEGVGLGNPYAGDLLAPYVRPTMEVPVDVPVTLESFSSGDMFIEEGEVACGIDFPSTAVAATFSDIEAGAIPPLVVFAGVRSRSASAYLPASECGPALDEACPVERRGALHVFPTACTPSAGAAMVRVVNLSPNQAAIRLTQENELVSPEADVVSSLAYGEATEYFSMADESERIGRVWRIYDAAGGDEFATVNVNFDTTSGGLAMEAPTHGTCSTLIVTRQRADRFSTPALLVRDAP